MAVKSNYMASINLYKETILPVNSFFIYFDRN